MLLRILWVMMCFPAACGVDSSPLEVRGAWVRPILPTQNVTAGYLDAVNSGLDTIRIIDVSSPAFDTVELHEMTTDSEGVMRMKRMGAFVVAPGDSVALRPGGKHLMLIGPRHTLSEGNDVPITLETNRGGRVTFAARVERRAW